MRDALRTEAQTRVAADLMSAALIGLVLVLPFAVLESLNQTVTRQNAPGLLILFGLLWLLPTTLVVALAPLARSLRAGNSLLANPADLLLRVALSVFVLMLWGGLLLDQMPCFMGVPNCD